MLFFTQFVKKRKNWEIMRKPLLFFPGKNVSIMKLKIKISWWHFQFFFLLIKSKKLLSAEKRTNFECMYIFYSLLFFFFLAGGCFISFLDASIASGLKRGFFLLWTMCILGGWGRGQNKTKKLFFMSWFPLVACNFLEKSEK